MLTAAGFTGICVLRYPGRDCRALRDTRDGRVQSFVTSCAVLWVAHTWRSFACVREVRIHRKERDICATRGPRREFCSPFFSNSVGEKKWKRRPGA